MNVPWRPDVAIPRTTTATAELAPDPDSLAPAAGFLAIGSFVLFVGSGLFLPLSRGYALFLICLPIYAATILHAAAWWFVGRHAVRFAAARPLVFASFVASLVLFALSMWSLFRGLAPVQPLDALVFPTLPWVWGPVVLAHAVLFGVAACDLTDPRARPWARAGTYILAGLAVVGLLGQVHLIDLGIGLYALAGWTFVGYLLLASCFTWGSRVPVAAAQPPARGFAA